MKVCLVVEFEGEIDAEKATWLERRLDWEVGKLAEEEKVDYEVRRVPYLLIPSPRGEENGS